MGTVHEVFVVKVGDTVPEPNLTVRLITDNSASALLRVISSPIAWNGSAKGILPRRRARAIALPTR